MQPSTNPKVKGGRGKRILMDLVSLVRFAVHQDNELVPFPERVNVNFKAWLGQQENMGKKFTDEQKHWFEMIRDHIAANLSIEKSDFDYAPFAQEGGIGKVYQLFGEELNKVMDELNGTLAAELINDRTMDIKLEDLPNNWRMVKVGESSPKSVMVLHLKARIIRRKVFY